MVSTAPPPARGAVSVLASLRKAGKKWGVFVILSMD